MSETQTTERIPTVAEALKEQKNFFFKVGERSYDIGEIRFGKNNPLRKDEEDPINSFYITAIGGELVGFNISRITRSHISGYTFIAGKKITLSLEISKLSFLKYSDDPTKLNIWYGNEKI